MKHNKEFICIIFITILLFNIFVVLGSADPKNNDMILITNSETYKQYGFDDLGIYYTNEGLTYFDMPFIIKNSVHTISSKNDLDGRIKIKTSNFEKRENNYNYEILDSNKQYSIINYHIDIKASTENFNIDFIPIINGNEYKEYAWFNSSWLMNKMFTINHSMIDEVLTDFPVLVQIPSYEGAYCDNGNSIRFVSMDNTTEYPYEIDTWNTSGTSFVWVKLPVVYSNIDTNFMMYYNNSNAIDDETPSDVWDDDYVGVWHLNEDNATHTFDSTANNNHGELKNSINVYNNSFIGNGFLFDSIDDYIDIGDNLDMGTYDYTISAIISTDYKTGSHVVVSKSRAGGETGRYSMVVKETSGYLTGVFDGIYVNIEHSGDDDIADGDYHNIVYTFDRDSYMIGYVDSVLTGTNVDISGDDGTDMDVSTHLGFGCGWDSSNNPTVYFDGIIDEVRISNVVHSNAWLSAEYNNTFDYDNFMTASIVHYYEDDNTTVEGDITVTIIFDTTQFIILLELGLFILFIWLSYKIPPMENDNKTYNKIPFIGGLFTMYSAITFMAFTLSMGVYDIPYIQGFFMGIAVLLLVIGSIKAFYY